MALSSSTMLSPRHLLFMWGREAGGEKASGTFNVGTRKKSYVWRKKGWNKHSRLVYHSLSLLLIHFEMSIEGFELPRRSGRRKLYEMLKWNVKCAGAEWACAEINFSWKERTWTRTSAPRDSRERSHFNKSNRPAVMAKPVQSVDRNIQQHLSLSLATYV